MGSPKIITDTQTGISVIQSYKELYELFETIIIDTSDFSQKKFQSEKTAFSNGWKPVLIIFNDNLF